VGLQACEPASWPA